eukprot:maker-scaffold603_size126491-snap-gene-0.24 protein:Tk03882 transcript:maker-scaffold603_size126491-snap-gene-0.24-mRNA-1 annotation:"hypothetical protein SINV_10094"
MDLPPKTLEDEALEVTSPPFSVKASELEPTFEMGEEDEVLLFGTQNLNPTLAQRLLENKLGINPNAETTTKKLMEEIHTEPMEVLVATTTTEIPASASTTIRPPPISCKQKNCQKLSSYLSSSMDWDKDPCDNFQGFMCGNWLERFEVPKFTPSWGFMEQNEDWDLFRTAKKAFQSCMDVDAIERNGYKLWKEEVEDEINGFPMAEDFWRQGTFDPNKMGVACLNFHVSGLYHLSLDIRAHVQILFRIPELVLAIALHSNRDHVDALGDSLNKLLR